MTAKITREGRKCLAWCEECQDGLRDNEVVASYWADSHNRKRHSE